MQTAIETTGTVGANRSIVLDEGIPLKESSRVRVIVFLDDTQEEGDVQEADWLRAGAKNDVFEMLADEEDIYTLEDGRPL